LHIGPFAIFIDIVFTAARAGLYGRS